MILRGSLKHFWSCTCSIHTRTDHWQGRSATIYNLVGDMWWFDRPKKVWGGCSHLKLHYAWRSFTCPTHSGRSSQHNSLTSWQVNRPTTFLSNFASLVLAFDLMCLFHTMGPTMIQNSNHQSNAMPSGKAWGREENQIELTVRLASYYRLCLNWNEVDGHGGFTCGTLLADSPPCPEDKKVLHRCFLQICTLLMRTN